MTAIQGVSSSLRRAALTWKAQSFGAEGSSIAAVNGLEAAFHNNGKSRPYSTQIYLTTSIGRWDHALVPNTFRFTIEERYGV
jgi:hypothetical protein